MQRTQRLSTSATTSRVPPLPSTVLGCVAGSLSSLIGLGGGFVLTPALTSNVILKRALLQHEAQATTLASIVFSSVAASCSYLYAKSGENSDHTDRSTSTTSAPITSSFTPKMKSLCTDAAIIALGGLFMSPLGVRVGKRFDSDQLKRLMGVFMMMVGPTVPLRGHLEKSLSTEKEGVDSITSGDSPPPPSSPSPQTRLPQVFTIGLFAGFSAGLFGVGGGAIVVPALALLGNPSIPSYSYTDILTTSLLSMSLPAMLATYKQRELVIWQLSGYLSAGSAAGGALTAKMVESLKGPDKEVLEDRLRYLFAGVLVVLGARFARIPSLRKVKKV
ncbi:hypothetical protein TrCOL_g2773 [Triparma columacea]|uniref:Membrane transporter protein n=1 Tax=Triparma columacea TaxID=722753 RepID=A0A9W7LDZ7_9STRA|nr:hypothetical protein TrCOL_g2773 [Triparma columacea]